MSKPAYNPVKKMYTDKGYKAFCLYTTVMATIKTPTRCMFGKISISTLDANINAPSIANIAISFTFIFMGDYSTTKEYVAPAVISVVSTPLIAYWPPM